MSYNYSQLNEIIALQYAKKEETNDNDWFLEQTIKMSKGYINPGNYFTNVGTKIIDNIYDKNKDKKKTIDDALYKYQ
jgi:hypothetical protein